MQKEKPINELLNFSILNINKPVGPTSFSVSDYVRKTIGLGKTSHFGTLDPQVSGVLPVALGRACKLTGFFLGHDKTYMGVMHVHKEVNKEKIQEEINRHFIGKIMQKPPVKSRVKRAEREREIKRFEILEQGEKDFLFIAQVEGGTYIRKLCFDLGEVLGVGAHMLELRRVQAGIFNEEDKEFASLYEFKEAVEEYKKGKDEKLRKMLIPAEEAIKKVMPVVEVKKESLKQLWIGKPVFKKDLDGGAGIKKGKIFAVFSGERFVEIAEKTDEKTIFGRPKFVFN